MKKAFTDKNSCELNFYGCIFLRTIFFNDENSLPSVWLEFFVENFKIELFYNDFQLWIGVSGSLRLRSDYHESIECDIELFPGNNKKGRNLLKR